MNLLFTCAGRRTYLINYFKEALAGDGLIVCADMQLSAPALSAADIRIQVPGVYDSHYVEKVLEICKDYQIKLLISLNDLELPILSDRKSEFESIGVRVAVSSPEVIRICFDKFLTCQFASRIGLNIPRTFIDLEEAIAAIRSNSISLPVILKPRWGSGSIGMEYVDDLDDLSAVYFLLKKKLRKSILKNASSNSNEILIQEVVNGVEFGLDIMNDLDGNFQFVSVKRKLGMRSGETDKATTIDDEALRNIGEKISKQLKHIGNLDCDILAKDGKYYLIDLNPRFGGGYPFSHEAGVNLPKAMIEWTKGNVVPLEWLTPKYGLTFAKCDYLVNVTV